MGITGNLKTMALSDLLQWLSQGRKTGTLVIEHDKVEKKIFFDQGTIISSASNAPAEYLGNFLASRGYLTEEQVDEAVAQQKEKKTLLGKILVEMEAIEEEDLHQLLRLKAEESIYDIFTWDSGEFRLLDGELPEETMIPMSLDVQWIVLEGSRRLDEWARLREHVPSRHCVPVSVADLGMLEEVEEADARILALIDDERSVEEISQEARTTVFLVSQILAEQVKAGTIKVVKPRVVEIEVIKEAAAESAQPAPVQPVMAQPVMAQPVYAQPPPGYAPQGYAPPAPAPPPGGVNLSGLSQHPSFSRADRGGAPPSAAASDTEAGRLLRDAETALRGGDLEQALATFRQAKSAEGADSSVVLAAEAGEDKVREALDRDGVKLEAIPRLSCGMEQLTQLKISPQEGFMLTRVNGSYDIKSLLKMSPGSKVDTQLLFWRLKKSGHVAF